PTPSGPKYLSGSPERGRGQGSPVPGDEVSRSEIGGEPELRPDRIRARALRVAIRGLEDRFVVRRAEREPGWDEAVQRLDVVREHVPINHGTVDTVGDRLAHPHIRDRDRVVLLHVEHEVADERAR